MIKKLVMALILSSIICSATFAQENTVKKEEVNMFKKLTPNIMVNDVNKTIDYYKQNLGFEYVMGCDEDKKTIMEDPKEKILIFAMIKKGQTEIFFQKKESLVEELPEFKNLEMGGAFTLYFSIQDVKKFYDEIKDKVEIIKDMHKTFYGVDEFVIKDINGCILYFGEAQNE